MRINRCNFTQEDLQSVYSSLDPKHVPFIRLHARLQFMRIFQSAGGIYTCYQVAPHLVHCQLVAEPLHDVRKLPSEVILPSIEVQVHPLQVLPDIFRP